MYKLESYLVSDFEYHVTNSHNPFMIYQLAFEFNYNNGRVDIIGRADKGFLLSFEAKLNNWQKALNQAYRNTCFSHFSYVLLPKETVKNAKKCPHEFFRRKVGLCFVSDSTIKIEIPAIQKKPIQPWLTNSAVDYIIENNRYAK